MRFASELMDVGRRSRGRRAQSRVAGLTLDLASERAVAEISGLFRDLRRILRLSLPELASRLGTRIDVISALERGETHRLPPWPETVRVITAFTSLADIDPRPVLGIIRQQMELGARTITGSPLRRRPMRAVAAALSERAARARSALEENRVRLAHFAAGSRRRAPRLRWKAVVAVLAILGIGVATYLKQRGWSEAALSSLPPPFARIAGAVQDFLVWQAAPTRDGLRWIEVEDPRTRRGDRLENTAR